MVSSSDNFLSDFSQCWKFISNDILVNFSCLYVNWGRNRDQICLPEGHVSNFSITTKYDLVEAKGMIFINVRTLNLLEFHQIAPFDQQILEI